MLASLIIIGWYGTCISIILASNDIVLCDGLKIGAQFLLQCEKCV